LLDVDAMFATRLLNVALDRIPETREETASQVAKFLETDLVCHLADEEPRLLERQEAAWRPLRDWAAEELGVALTPASGIVAQDQPAESLEAGRVAALALDDVALAALAHATAMLGSAVLAFALLKERIDAIEAFEAARVDEMFQEELWGVDEEASIRALHMAKELGVTERVMRAL
jgi:chaperone required for assembly of F1-ATPase